jgi:hypothetical protein
MRRNTFEEEICECSRLSFPEISDLYYVGCLEDGTEFDSSRSRKELFTFVLGKGLISHQNKHISHIRR